MLNNRLHDLTRSYKSYQRLKTHMKNSLKSLSTLKEDHIRLQTYIGEQVRRLSQTSEAAVRALLDFVGETVGKQVQSLAQQLSTQAEEARIAKGESRAKEETIDRF